MRVSEVHVVIPAHDEEGTIDDCLQALWLSAAAVSAAVSVTVVCDSCSDSTERLAAARAHVLRVDERCVGAARATGLRHVSDLHYGDSGVWLATTDADSLVPGNWIATQLELARLGADVVAGLVRVDDWRGWDGEVVEAYRRGYRGIDGHRHIHGANLGCSARAYRALGGFATLTTGEDVDLVRRAEERGMTIAWESAHPVVTSSRRTGRAPGGFASHLRDLDAETRALLSGDLAGARVP